MRIVPFPAHPGEPPDPSSVHELEAALAPGADDPSGAVWRDLREEVRALAPAPRPEFERELQERICQPRARRRAFTSAPLSPGAVADAARRRSRARPLAAAGSLVAIVIVALVLLVPQGSQHGSPTHAGGEAPLIGPRSSGSGVHGQAEPVGGASGAVAGAGANQPSTGNGVLEAAKVETDTPGRVQQLSATLSLATEPASVQAVANAIGRMAAADGGYVQSSHVQVQQGSAGEAMLLLKLPSAKLSGELAALSQLAPVHAESQSLQDITSSYEAARRQLADATAAREALLRALARAQTQGQIDSLREQLAQASSAVGRAHASLAAVSRRGSNAEVEVTVQGSGTATNAGLSLHRGLHDAGRVLTVIAVVLLIAAAVLIPLALVFALLARGWRTWRRLHREQALDGG